MQTKLFIAVLITFCILFSGSLIAAESADVGDAGLKEAEAKAKTNFDHVKLAEYYDKEAKEMSAKAEEQKKLLEEYKSHSEYYGREGQDFRSHHEVLLREYEKAVERNMEMAVSHRKMSRKVKGL